MFDPLEYVIKGLSGGINVDSDGGFSGNIDMTPEETKALAPVLALGAIAVIAGFIAKIVKE